jgi:hypothetical protein
MSANSVLLRAFHPYSRQWGLLSLVQYRNVAGRAAENRRDSRERPTPGSRRRNPLRLNRSPGSDLSTVNRASAPV